MATSSLKIKFGIKAVSDKLINVDDEQTAKRVIYAHPDFVVRTVISDEADPELGMILSTKARNYAGKNYRKYYRKTILWDFGDGFKEEGVTSSHVYVRPGKYKITATFFDVDRRAYEDSFYIYVIVKEVIPTQLGFRSEPLTQVYCSELVKLTELDSFISKNYSKTFSIVPKRVDKNLYNEKTYDDLVEEGGNFFHLREYYAFLQKEKVYKNNFRTIYEEIYQPVTKFTPEYREVYTRFFVNEESGKIDFEGYVVSPIKEDLKLNFIDPNEEVVGEASFEQYKDYFVDTRLEANDFSFTGYWGKAEIYYRTDFHKSLKNSITFAQEIDIKSLDENVSQTESSYLNVLPLGINFEVLPTDATKVNYLLTLDGFIDSDRKQRIKAYISDELYQSFTENYDAPFYIIPFIEGSIAPYIPKDYDIWRVLSYSREDNDSILFECPSESDSFYKKMMLRLNKVLNINMVVNDTSFSLYKDNLQKDVVIPKEKMIKEDLPRLLEAYMPHKMFSGADDLKSFFTNVLGNGDILNYILTRSDSFLDDTANHKSCYVKNLISILKSMGEDVAEFETSDFEGVNEIRDFARILSMNHTDLVGHVVDNQLDTSYRTDDDKGVNVGERVFPNDVLSYEDGKISAFGRDGSRFKLKKLNWTNSLIIKDDYTKEIRVVSLYPLLKKDSGSFSIKNYDDSWGWCLSLPDEFYEKSASLESKAITMNRYYSFFLVNPVVGSCRIGAFLEDETITDGVEDVEKWGVNGSFPFDVLDKIIKDKMCFNNNGAPIDGKWSRS